MQRQLIGSRVLDGRRRRLVSLQRRDTRLYHSSTVAAVCVVARVPALHNREELCDPLLIATPTSLERIRVLGTEILDKVRGNETLYKFLDETRSVRILLFKKIQMIMIRILANFQTTNFTKRKRKTAHERRKKSKYWKRKQRATAVERKEKK